MIETSLFDLARWAGGALVTGVPSDTAFSISTDTRDIQEGQTFLALKGDQFNGHEFVEKAIEAGAAHLIVSELPVGTETFEGGVIHVRNSLDALQGIALHYRRDNDRYHV